LGHQSVFAIIMAVVGAAISCISTKEAERGELDCIQVSHLAISECGLRVASGILSEVR